MASHYVKLYSYSHPRYARRTVQRLRSKWPNVRFDVEISPSMSYAFRYVIMATMANGRRACVEKVRKLID